MNNDDFNISKFHYESMSHLSDEIKTKSVEFLKKHLSQKVVEEIKQLYKNDKQTWWASEHFGYGMYIRNQLRSNVCPDNELPSGNWDDYYVPLMEATCGLRDW